MKKLVIIIFSLIFIFFLTACDEKSLGDIEATNIRRRFVTEEQGLPLINEGDYRGFFRIENQLVLLTDVIYFMIIEMSFISNIESDKKFSPRFDAIIEIENFNVLSSKTYEVSSGENLELPMTQTDGVRVTKSTTTFSMSSEGSQERTFYVVVKLSPKLSDEIDTLDSKVVVSFTPKDKLNIYGTFQDGTTFTITIKKDDTI